MSTPPRALLILGMHRSGTSSFAGLLARLGVPIGEDLLEANEWNPAGYAEHAGVVAIHDRFLAASGLRWDSARMPRDFEGAAAQEAREALAALLRREFAGAALFAVKDPRMCRLLPLWWPVLAELGIEPAPILVLRHPVEVAASLERRDGLARAHAHLLWTQHTLAAERETRSHQRAMLVYDEVMRDWRALAKRVASELALAWPRDPEEAAADVDDFLRADLRHHRAPDWPAGEAERFPHAARTFELQGALVQQGDTEERRAALDAVGAAAEAAAALYEPALAEAERALAGAEGRASELEREWHRAERRRQRLIASPWLWLKSFLNHLLGRGAA